MADETDTQVEARLDHADRLEGDVKGGVEHHAPEPELFGMPPATVVSIAMAVFLLILVIKKVPSLIGGTLDKQIGAIRDQLDEAKALRAEAEKLRAEYASKIANAEQDAAAMLGHAKAEATAIIAKAETDAAQMVVRREKMAQDKIAAAERGAVEELRAKAANAAAEAARALIAARHDAGADAKLVDEAIARI